MTDAHVTPGEQRMASYLREHVAPVVTEGIVAALRDQPLDPAGYLAEFLGARGGGGGGGASAGVDAMTQRRLNDECARLDAEAKALEAQLHEARAQLGKRLPERAAAEAVRAAETASAARFHETRRLKKLIRAMKSKTGLALDPSDWLLPEGVLLVQAAPGVDGVALCERFARDFGAAFEAAPAAADAEYLGGVRQSLEALAADAQRQPLLLLHGALVHDKSASHNPPPAAISERLATLYRNVGVPVALLLLDPHAGQPFAEAAALAHAAGAAQLACHRVACGGDADEQMSNLLTTISSC